MKFLRLYELLTESSDKRSWLDPSGKFHPLGEYEHSEWAMNYFYKTQPSNIRELSTNSNLFMMKKGWHRVVYVSHVLISNNEFVSPNPKQLSALKQLAWNAGFEKLIWDSGEDEKILWTQNDIL